MELKVAKAWGLTPRTWRTESADDRALMIAYVMMDQTRECFVQEWVENQSKSEREKPKGVNPYRALLTGMGLK